MNSRKISEEFGNWSHPSSERRARMLKARPPGPKEPSKEQKERNLTVKPPEKLSRLAAINRGAKELVTKLTKERQAEGLDDDIVFRHQRINSPAGKAVQQHLYDEPPDIDWSSIDADELDLGRSVEMEHTPDPTKAEAIALDHLAKDPQYYTKMRQARIGETFDAGKSKQDYLDLDDETTDWTLVDGANRTVEASEKAIIAAVFGDTNIVKSGSVELTYDEEYEDLEIYANDELMDVFTRDEASSAAATFMRIVRRYQA
jgi:hypothetical protein